MGCKTGEKWGCVPVRRCHRLRRLRRRRRRRVEINADRNDGSRLRQRNRVDWREKHVHVLVEKRRPFGRMGANQQLSAPKCLLQTLEEGCVWNGGVGSGN